MASETQNPTVVSALSEPNRLSQEDLLRFEHALLLSERRFLEAELQASPDVFARMTSSRLSDATEECLLLKSYLEALERGEKETCKAVDEKLRRKVAEMKRKATLLEKVLRGVRKEVRFVLDHSLPAPAEAQSRDAW